MGTTKIINFKEMAYLFMQIWTTMWGIGKILKPMATAHSSTMRACGTRGRGRTTSNTVKANSYGKTAQSFEASSSTGTKSTDSSSGPTTPPTSANSIKIVSKARANSPIKTTATTMESGRTT